MYTTTISPTMCEKKRMRFDLEVKSLARDGTFSGYASVFDVLDNHNDIIKKGAFRSTLKKGTGRIKLLWQHKQDEPIGTFSRIFEDEMGLYVEGKLLLGLQRGKEAYSMLKQGIVSGLSIGYSPLHYDVDQQSGARILTDIELWEVSLVTFPANEAAGVTVVKSMAEKPATPTELIELQDAVDRAIRVLR